MKNKYLRILERIKKVNLLIKNTVLPVILSARLWLAVLFTVFCVIFSSKYYINKEILYGISFYKIDYCILAIIIFLSSVFSYGLFSYICDFKSVEKKSTSDILLTCIFIFLLFLPLSYINTDNTRYIENRKSAQYKPLFINSKINNNFGKDFENWFNDRFFLRNQLINLNKNIMNSINTMYKDKKVIVDKKTGWFFLAKEIENTYKMPNIEELWLLKNNLEKLNDFCRENDIKMYIVIIPDKTNIYREFVPTENLKNRKTITEYFNQFLKNNGDINFSYIYPVKELLDAKKTFSNKLLCYKTDSHQTDWGAYITYQALMKEINKDFPEISISTLDKYQTKKNKKVNFREKENDFHLGNVNEMSLKDPRYLDYDYEYYYNNNERITTAQYDNPNLYKKKTYNPDGHGKAMLLGSSFVEKLNIFLADSFKYTDKIRLNTAYEKNFHISRFADRIKKEKPDILVVVINESEFYDYVSTMYNDKLELEP